MRHAEPDFRADELITGNAAFQYAGTFLFHGKGSIPGAAGDTILVYGIFCASQAGAGVQRNIGFPEVDGQQKNLQSGDEQPGIVDRFILIRGTRLLSNNDFRMFFKETPVVEANMAEISFASR